MQSPKKQQVKINFYKFVSLPAGGTGGGGATLKVGNKTIAGGSSGSFVTGLNRLGGTLNSIAVIQKNILTAMTSSVRSDYEFYYKFDKQLDKENKLEKRISDNNRKLIKRKKDAESELAQETTTAKKSQGTESTKASKKATIGFFEGLAKLGGSLFRLFIGRAVLQWISDPKNIEKVANIWTGLSKVFTFLMKFFTDNVAKTLDGLFTMFDSNKNFWERLQGFGTFIVGFGSLLIGMRWLRNPVNLVKDVFWVLKTVFNGFKDSINFFKNRKNKGPRTPAALSSGRSVPAASAPGGSPDTPKGGKPRGGRFGALATAASGAAALAPVLLPMAFGEPQQQQTPQTPQLATGGIATKPTRATVGERGPEAILKLGNRPQPNVSNDSLKKQSGIKPLSALPRMNTNANTGKQSKKLSDLFMVPFRGIGAGVIANVADVVGKFTPAGMPLAPVLGNIIAPIANSFGVPVSVVKTIGGKTESLVKGATTQIKSTGGKGIQKIFGKPSRIDSKSKEFRKVGDTSVLGLLSNLVNAAAVINNKIGKSADQVQQTTEEQTSQSDPGNPDTGSKTTQTADGKAGTGRMSQVAGTSAGVGVTDKDRNRQTNELEANFSEFDHDGKRYKVRINPNNGSYSLYEKGGFGIGGFGIDKEIMIGGPKGPEKGGLNEKLLQKSHNEVKRFFMVNAQQKGIMLKYLTKDGVDAFNKSPEGQRLIAERKKKAAEKKAAGGWIHGPQSGYPVSLDGGGSTSFIGHGTEWVGFKKATGGAFVIPYDTPATKNNPRLTESRFKQAKQGGYALPYAKGGSISTDPNWKGDTGPGSRWSFVSNAKSKDALMRKRGKRKFADGGKIAEAAKSMVGQYFGANGCAKSTRAMLAKAGVAPSPVVTSKVLDKGTPGAEPTGILKANSFGPDQGAVVKSAGSVESGDIVMWDTGGGVIGHVGVAIGNGQVVHNSSSAGHKLAKMGITGMKFHSAIRLGKTGTVSGSDTSSSGGDTSGGGDQEMSPEQQLQAALGTLTSSISDVNKSLYGPSESSPSSQISGQTTSTDKAKTEAQNAAQTLSTRAATAGAAASVAASKPAPTPPPTPPKMIPIMTSEMVKSLYSGGNISLYDLQPAGSLLSGSNPMLT